MAVAVSWAITAASIRLGRRAGFVDVPDGELKTHTRSAVPLGGVGVFAGLHAGLAVAGRFDTGLVVATSIVVALGLLDDRIGLSPVTRIVGVSLSGVALVLLATPVEGPAAGLVGVFVVLMLVNAVNLLDGLDTLAGGVTAVAALGMAWLGAMSPGGGPLATLWLAGAIVGFLWFNRPPASSFLGDNGAYVVGLTLAWGALGLGPGVLGPSLGVAVVGVPLIDLGSTVLRRLRTGAPLFGGDRDHTYDRLARRRLSTGGVAGLYALAQIVWVVLIVVTQIIFGETTAVVTAMIVGLAVVLWGSSAFRDA